MANTQPRDPDRSLTMTRVFPATTSRILECLSDPEILTHWWGPNGFSTTTETMDFRPGGFWKFVMHGPDGTDYPNYIKYLEAGPDVIRYDHGEHENSSKEFSVTITLKPLGDKTEMEFDMYFESAEHLRQVKEEFGAETGLAQTLSRLEQLLKGDAS